MVSGMHGEGRLLQLQWVGLLNLEEIPGLALTFYNEGEQGGNP
jgi:hypothetical protein